MPKVKITVVESKCRCGYHKTGDSFIIEDICPPICHELWNYAYSSIYALLNGALLDCGQKRDFVFDVKCPDEGRVVIHGECIND